ncbi:UDP-Glycosyltransferase/glycogen phosphorylase [Dentipellis sp. KUC8613]|nr:UDP-Glycosyltransferase/glycogen phosphorylase [Dentipellis sp. KUC8613]
MYASLWPLFHHLLWQDVVPNSDSNSTSFSADAHWPPYEAANAAFARHIAEIYQPGNLVCVHGRLLLLIPVPRIIRGLVSEGVDADGQALHPDGSAQVPGQGQGICIGLFVHTPWPSNGVFGCSQRREEILDGIGANQGHVAAVRRYSVGVDAERVAMDLLRPGIQPNLAALPRLYTGAKIIIGRDELDVVKGVMQKLRVFAKCCVTTLSGAASSC